MIIAKNKKVIGARFAGKDVLKVFLGATLRADFTKKPQPDGPKEYEDYKYEYFTIENVGENDIGYYGVVSTGMTGAEFSLNGGSWSPINQLSIPIGGKARIRKNNTSTPKFSTPYNGQFKVYGNMNSLYAGDDFADYNVSKNAMGNGWFENNHGLVDAENLYLPENFHQGFNSFARLFVGCINLVKAPKKIKAVIGGDGGNRYLQMFYNCTSLEVAPEIDVTGNFNDPDFSNMFTLCGKLNYIKCLNENTDPSFYSSWVYGVAPTGTFVKKAGTSWEIGDDGIPEGWVVEDAPKEYDDYKSDYFTLENIGSTTFTPAEILVNTLGRGLQFSLNNGDWTYSTGVQVQPGDTMRIKGTSTGTKGDLFANSDAGHRIKVYGNPNSLFGGDDFVGFDKGGVLYVSGLFRRSTFIVDAENLYIPDNLICDYGLNAMFAYCSELEKAPKRIKGTVQSDAYNKGESVMTQMFINCTKLKETPVIDIDGTFLGSASSGTFTNMFRGCSSLEKVTCLNTDANPNFYQNWMNGVPSTGTFYKKRNVSWDAGVNGIQSGWTIVEVD